MTIPPASLASSYDSISSIGIAFLCDKNLIHHIRTHFTPRQVSCREALPETVHVHWSCLLQSWFQDELRSTITTQGSELRALQSDLPYVNSKETVAFQP